MSNILSAQMPNGLDTLYGHEWINADQEYLQIQVSADGFYRINAQDIIAAGWPANSIAATNYSLIHQGQTVYLYNSNEDDSPLGTDDYLVFYGQKNRGALDRHLFRDEAQSQLNPEYSLISDTATYYLTYSDTGHSFSHHTNDLTDVPLAEPYVLQEEALVHSNHFVKEYYRYSSSTLYYSHMGIGEGYGSRSINQLLADGATTQDYTLPLNNAYTTGPAAVLESRYVAALGNHLQQLSVNEELLRSDTFSNWRMMNVMQTLPNSVLTEEEARLHWEGFGGEKDEVSVGYCKITYPAIANANGQSIYQARLTNNGEQQYIEIADFDGSAAHVFDLNNGTHTYVSDITAGQLNVVLPVVSEDRHLMIVAAQANMSTANLLAVNLELPQTNNADYIILTHSDLRTGNDAVQAYADYRASFAGGMYQTAVVNIDELYDQFAYGVFLHPLAIRNFVAWQRKTNPNFKYLFIVGKGREYIHIRSSAQVEEALGNSLFIPSFGYPASDNLLVSDILKPTPLVSIGRLPAISAAEVNLYLGKVQALESQINNPQTIADRAWMKNIIHLGGGSTPSEQASIRTALANMADEAAGGKFGAQTTSFYKSSTEPIQVSVTDQIFDRINEGVSILTFFGHSSAGTFDFSIDNPDNYLNAPKYPLMLSLGCYSGNMFGSTRSIGERFMTIEDGGAAAYGASRGLGFIQSLNAFANTFYHHMSNDYYGLPIGDGIRVSIAEYEDRTDAVYGTLNEQFSLQGDPGLRLSAMPAPDYVFDTEQTRFEPSLINAQQDSFELVLRMQNIGRAVADSIDVQIRRFLPNATAADTIFVLRVPSPAYAEDLQITLPTKGTAGVGQNRIMATLNINNGIEEQPSPVASQNNELLDANGQAGIPFFIIDNTALPVWPPRYALVGESDIALKASTADAFAPERTYYMQLDTTPEFLQPIEQTTVVQRGGVIEWTPSYNWQDSTVYYWRISPDSTEIGIQGYAWEASSFTYINGIAPGWGQGHWGQYGEGHFDLMSLNEDNNFIFNKDLANIRIRNKTWDGTDRPGLVYDNLGYASSVRPWNYLNSGMAVVVYEADDPNGFWRNPPPGNPFEAGDYGVPTGNSRVFAFPTATQAERSNFMTFLNDVVPEEAYVFVFSIVKNLDAELNIQDWAQDSIGLGQNIFQLLENQGAELIRNLEVYGSVPYIFMYRKNLEVIRESLSSSIESEVNADFDLPITLQAATYKSPLIKDVPDWNRLTWGFETISENDLNRITIYAGEEQMALDSIYSDTVSLNGMLDLSTLNLEDKKYMQLIWDSQDDLDRTPSPLKYWHVTHGLKPDLAINPAIEFFQSHDTIVQGDQFRLQTAITNISSQDVVDSIKVGYGWYVNSGAFVEDTIKVTALAAGESRVVEINLETKEVQSNPQLIIDVNPIKQPSEQTYINNAASLELHLQKDEINPIVDVSFDGNKIFDGDIVSANTQVLIRLQDENIFIPLNDPNLFDIKVKTPNGLINQIDPLSEELNFSFEFDTDKNQADISFYPVLDQSGIYTLIVKAKDSSGNLTGVVDYEVNFEVVLETQLSNILPYPNPFTTSTRFVYTLTGGERIEGVAIQIMTVSGRIVKTITEQDLGMLEVGTHTTDYEWDGTDDYGDQLANGVYLYRVLFAEDDIPSYKNGQIDSFFKNGLGKIVLLR